MGTKPGVPPGRRTLGGMVEPDPPTMAPTAAPHPRRRGPGARLHDTLDAIRARRTGRVTLKIVIAVVGALVVAVGIALVPLPGPGWAIVFLGLAIWAVEFVWARHLLRYGRRLLRRWTGWVGRQSLTVRLVLGAAGLVFVTAVVWASLRFSLGVDLIAVCRDYLATR